METEEAAREDAKMNEKAEKVHKEIVEFHNFYPTDTEIREI